jgi:hypothetical protein
MWGKILIKREMCTAVISTTEGTCNYIGMFRISKNKLAGFIFVESSNDKLENYRTMTLT